jgi:hypothetical protein
MKASWLIHPRNLVVYALVVCTALASMKLDLNMLAVGAVLMVFLFGYYFVLTTIALRRIPAFDRSVSKLLVQGKPDEALRLYRRQWLLRGFSPPGLIKDRLGQIHAARRAWNPAFQAFHEALRAARPGDDLPVKLGYVEAGFHVGEDVAIGRVMSGIGDDPRLLPQTLFLMVHVMVANPDMRAQARKWLGLLRQRATADDASLVLLAEAELFAALGKRTKSRETLSEIDRESLPSTLRSLATLLEAKMAHVEGQKSKATKLFDRVRRDDACGRARIELEEFFEDQ